MTRLRSVQALVYRVPIETPVVTSFGTMTDRPMLLVRAEDANGAVGWGEVWCNFPAFGPEHRARIIDQLLAPKLMDRTLADPAEAFAILTAHTRIIALQSGEAGPFAQCIAGVDAAMWDNPDQPAVPAANSRMAGHVSFKLKVGFGLGRDLANLADVRAALGHSARLMADANQGWTLAEAREAATAMAPFDLCWLEEPIGADRAWAEWKLLAEVAPMPLAAGENLLGAAAVDAAIHSGALGVVQPDLGKWGGITGTAPVAREIVAAGLSYCPHWLGGGVGLLASAHLLAATGGPGALEMDVNPNPLRELTCGALATVTAGRVTLSDAPGLGASPDEAVLRPYRVRH